MYGRHIMTSHDPKSSGLGIGGASNYVSTPYVLFWLYLI